MKSTLWRLSIVGIFLSAFAGGQTFQGTLRGRVVDPNGATTANAKLTLTDQGTQISRTTVTNGEGEYTFASVTPATYTVTVEASGFKTMEQKGVAIATQASVTLDLQLELGQISEEVTVTSETPPLQTADASTGQLINTQQVTDLPLLGRNPFLTGKLAQSVVFAGNPTFTRMQDQNGNSQFSIAGGPLRTNNYLVDGISIADSNNRAVILPSPEAVQELKVQASTYDAEVGRTGGGTFNTLLRSGTNDLHGSAVGHIRETDWLANSFFANRAGQPIANQPYRDWAFSLGGPIVIPKVYNGKNKTFFFASDESYRQQSGSTTTLSVPTALERVGNFSQSFTKAGKLQVIYDPSTTNPTTGARIPFSGNIIPASDLSALGLAIASYYPLPNAATSYYQAPNYNFTGSFPNRGDQRIFKADHDVTSWFRLSGSFIYQKTFETDSPLDIFPNAATPGQTLCCDRKVDATQADATITPNPTTVITVRWGFNRFYSKTTQYSAGFNLGTLGFPESLVDVTPNAAFPAITLGSAVNGCSDPTSNADFADYGGGCANQDVYYSRSFNITASKFMGKHDIKAGFDFRTLHDFGTPASGPTSLGFTDVFTRATPQTTTAGTGSDLATLLLGYPTSGQMSVVTSFNDFIRYYGGFVQDDYRITPKLTLNLGIRFEHESGIQEENNKLVVGFNPNVANPLQSQVTGLSIPGQVEYAGVNGNPTQTGNALSVRYAPRFGFAYALNNKTVIRGGYGIYWAPTFFSFQNAIGYSQTTTIVSSTNGNFTPATTLANPYPNGLLQPTGNSIGGLSGVGQPVTIFSPTAQSAGYVQEYSLEVQRELPFGFVITAGALGSHSLHLLESGQNIDQLDPAYFGLGSALTQSVANPIYGHGGVGSVGTAKVTEAQLLLPYPQYTSLQLSNNDSGSARYYSFYFRAQRRFAHGISLLASYTWSRSMDDLIGVSLAGASLITTQTGAQNAYNLNGEWSLSTQDVPNRFTTAITYELPFGRGKPFLNTNSRILNYAVGGWSINAFSTIQSGFPLLITQPNNNSVIGATYQRPNATGISPATSGSTDDRINDWLNTAAFSQAPQFTFGNISRFSNTRGPGLFDWDLSVFKSFLITERINAQFRAESFNATNTVEFGNPNTTYTSPTFGVITSQINIPRLIQLGVRVTF
ncbi:MAG: TonB-dependent receptor [Bryobacterales bacterium]|nr:TonB-dependent receptor [Bryobacterales bacterium]